MEFYGEDVEKFRHMLKKQNILLKRNVTRDLQEDEIDKMVKMTQKMERPLESALGKEWKNILTREKIIDLYAKM